MIPKESGNYTEVSDKLTERLIIGSLNPPNIIPKTNVFLVAAERDLLQELLADKRSPHTRKAYEKDLKDFFVAMAGNPPNPSLLAQFLSLPRHHAVATVLKYKAKLIDKGLAEATINRRLCALRSLVNYARKIGMCDWGLDDIGGERVQSYRDTRGVSALEFKAILDVCDLSTPKGIRDYALLRLLWDNALRRGEISALVVGDLDKDAATLKVLGKGKGKQKEIIDLHSKTLLSLCSWLKVRGYTRSNEPLFVSLDRASKGKRLSGDGIFYIVKTLSEKAGIKKAFSPHRVRHSSITAALDAGNDVRHVQRLSRHTKLDTLMIYDDNRQNLQSEVSASLAEMV